MAETLKIPTDQLKDYFDGFTKRFLRDDSPEVVTVEVVSPELGDYVAAQNVRLIGITYDRGDNSLELEMESGDHRIITPREVWAVEEDDGFVSAIEVVRPDGTRDIATVQRGDRHRPD